MSRMMRKPLDLMSQRVTGENVDQTYANLKYMIYSAHDTQVDNMMVWLTQKHDSFGYIPYASTVVFELMYSDACIIGKTIDQEPLNSCYGV